MKNWITSILPALFLIVGFIADDTALFLDFLKELNAPDWLFTIVKYIGLFWGAKKLYEAKSSKTKKEIETALATDPQSILGTDRPNDR